MMYPAKIFSALPGNTFLPTLLDFLHTHQDPPPSRIVFPHYQGVIAFKNLLKERHCIQEDFVKKAHICTLKEAIASMEKEQDLEYTKDANKPLHLENFLLRFVREMPESSHFFHQENKRTRIAGNLRGDFPILFAEDVQEKTLAQVDSQDLELHQQHFFFLLKESFQAWHHHCKNTNIPPSLYHVMNALRDSDKPWQRHTIFAGITFQEKALASMARSMLSTGNATVILPGYHASEANLSLEDHHPNASMSRFVRFCSPSGKEVKPTFMHHPSPRLDLLSSLFAPSENLLETWKSMDPHLVEKAMKGITHIVTQDEFSTCSQAALLTLSLLPNVEKGTLAIVSPSQTLLEITKTELLAHNIRGSMVKICPLSQHSWGHLLENTMLAMDSLRPDHVMTMLWNPLCAKHHREKLHALEASLGNSKTSAKTWEKISSWHQNVQDFAHHIGQQLILLKDTLLTESSFEQKWDAHCQMIHAIIPTSCDDESIHHQKWAQSLKEATHGMNIMRYEEYKDVLFSLLRTMEIPEEQNHSNPDLFLRTPMDQRLQKESTVLMLGMNAHDWPGSLSHTPFLTAKVRSLLKMSSPERWLSPKSHDWIQSMMAPHVYLFSSHKRHGLTAQESPFLKRLKFFLKIRKQEHLLKENLLKTETQYLSPESSPVFHKKNSSSNLSLPLHPFSLPKKPWNISVTSLYHLHRNSYCFYASSYLGLKPFVPLSYSLDIKNEEGQRIHKILERYMKQDFSSQSPASDIYERLKKHAYRYDLDGIYRMFFLARLEKISQWIAETNILHGVSNIEVEKSYTYPISSSKIFLKGRIDLLLHKGQWVSLWDYKTGTQKISLKKDGQLPLLAFLYHKGSPKNVLSKMGFIHLPQGRIMPEVRISSSDNTTISQLAETHFALLKTSLKEHLEGKPFVWEAKYAPSRDQGPGSFQHLASPFSGEDEL